AQGPRQGRHDASPQQLGDDVVLAGIADQRALPGLDPAGRLRHRTRLPQTRRASPPAAGWSPASSPYPLVTGLAAAAEPPRSNRRPRQHSRQQPQERQPGVPAPGGLSRQQPTRQGQCLVRPGSPSFEEGYFLSFFCSRPFSIASIPTTTRPPLSSLN